MGVEVGSEDGSAGGAEEGEDRRQDEGRAAGDGGDRGERGDGEAGAGAQASGGAGLADGGQLQRHGDAEGEADRGDRDQSLGVEVPVEAAERRSGDDLSRPAEEDRATERRDQPEREVERV